MMDRRLGLSATLLVLLITTLGAQQRRWFELYDEAVQHIRRSEWTLAETKLKQAQQNDPGPGRTVLRYGSWRDDYFPDFYLGIVYLNTKRPKEALRQFELARSQKLNDRDREFLPIADYEARAQRDAQMIASGPNFVPLPPPGPVVPPGGNVTSGPVTPPTPPLPDLGAQRRQIELQIEQAIQGGNVGAARGALIELQKRQPDAKVVETLTARVNTLERGIRLASSERSAMRAFYAGNYQATVSALNAIEAELGGPLSPRGYFYRACGLAAQALRGTQVDTKVLAEARRQYAEALKSRQLIAPDRRYVSPRILQALGS